MEWAAGTFATCRQAARIEIVDQHSGGWGHIDIDQIELADTPGHQVPLPQVRPRHLCLALSSGQRPGHRLDCRGSTAEAVFGGDCPKKPFGTKLAGPDRTMKLDPGRRRTSSRSPGISPTCRFPARAAGRPGRHYATRFLGRRRRPACQHASAVETTRLWHQTWYDSTLPYWFLDRTFANTSILATSTCHRFRNGRFYGWEGVGCCAGTCTHVWHYAHAVARLFPELERILREQVDYAEGIGFDPKTGIISHRAEEPVGPAVDGQAGNILRTYREHQMSADSAFLKRLWPRVKASLEYLIRHDPNSDGLLEGAQHNTLDAQWFGVVPWLSSLYIAALAAGEAMARELGDDAFAGRCRVLKDRGAKEPGRAALERIVRLLHPARRPCAREGGRLVRRLRDRPGVRPALGVPGRPGANPRASRTSSAP